MADLNKISEIGKVQADLDGDDKLDERLDATKGLTAAELKNHAGKVEVGNKDLFRSIDAAKAQIKEFLASSSGGEALLRDQIKSLIETATGEPIGGVESIWLAQQLQVTPYIKSIDDVGTPIDTSSLAAAGTATESATESTAVSPEKISELTDFLNSSQATFFKLSVLGIDVEGGYEDFFNGISERLSEPGVAAQVEVIQAVFPAIEWVANNPDVVNALKDNAEFSALNNEGTFFSSQQAAVLLNLQTALNGVTDPVERTRIIEEAIEKLPEPAASTEAAADTAANAAIESGDAVALIKGVPESMQSMFKTEYEAWSADMQVPGATLVKFQDYLVAQAGGDEGKLGTIALKIQLAGFIEMIQPFLDMFKSMTGKGTEDVDEPTEVIPTDPNLMTASQLAAAGGADAAETTFQSTRLTDVTAYFAANGAPVISDFYEVGEDGNSAFNAERASAFLALPENRDKNKESIEGTVNTIKTISPTTDQANIILQKGLSLADLTTISLLKKEDITEVTEDGITIGEQPPALFGDTFSGDLNTAVGGHNEAVAEAAETAAQAAAKTEFINSIRTKILDEAIQKFDDDNLTLPTLEDEDVHVDDNGSTQGFSIENGKLYLDMDRIGLSIDLEDQDLVLATMADLDLESMGYADEEVMLNDLRDTFKGKTIAEIRNN